MSGLGGGPGDGATAELAAAADRPTQPPGGRGRRFKRFLRHRLAVVSAVVLALLVLGSVGAPVVEWILDTDPDEANLDLILQGPSLDHPLGTDELGRDVLLRLLYGGQVSLFVGLIAALAAAIIGTIVGLFAGFYGGRVDSILMRVTDFIIALPVLPLLIVLAAVDLSKVGLPQALTESEDISLYRIVFIISLVSWTGVARLVRGATLSMKERDFVRAARALGGSNRRVMFVHILPNVVSPIVVATTMSVGGIILFESVLSFLGLGIQPPVASWGNMLTNAQELITTAPQMVVYPGVMIFLTVIAFNFLGDGLQDALDPRALND